MKRNSWLVAALLAGSVLPAHAATATADCTKKPLMATISKLDRTISTTVTIIGACNEDVVISGFADLTLVGGAGASVSSAGAAGSGTTVLVNERSKVTFQSLTINAGVQQGIQCTGRSACVLRNVTVTGGGNGVAAQDQSAMDILGPSLIQGSQGAGIGVFGASSVNVRPETGAAFGAPAATISGHTFQVCDDFGCFDNGIGVNVQDGSFFRSDNATISGNGIGVLAQRGAVIKVYGGNVGGVMNNLGDGIHVRFGSTAGLGTTISGNAGAGIKVGALSHFHDQGIILVEPNIVSCTHVTAVSQPLGWCNH